MIRDDIKKSLEERGYLFSTGFRDTGPVDVTILMKRVSAAPLPGYRIVEVVCFNFSNTMANNKRHVEFEVRARFKNDSGDNVEVKFFNIDENSIIDKLEKLEHELSLSHIALNGQYTL